MKGKLKIFFGYVAGVGKTYAMLQQGRKLWEEGVDVVIGYLEPHDRPDTTAQAEGLPTLSLRCLSYHGIEIKEFDVDEALKRHPQVCLVDELAHTNAVGCRNRKRYQDIEELLNAGIDVWTTVNVQHIQGLRDLVDHQTQVTVHELVPDEIFDLAEEVVLIDLEPDELIERLRRGKIYPSNRAYTALENFFQRDKLCALRELSMRRNADRMEKQANGGRLRRKILVLVSPSPSSARNIRTGARMADAYHCQFTSLYIERGAELSDESAKNLKAHKKLTQELGGEMVIQYGDDVVEAVADFVKISGATSLILGKTWQSVGKKVGLEDRFVARLPDVELLILPDGAHANSSRSWWQRLCMLWRTQSKQARQRQEVNRTLNLMQELLRLQGLHSAQRRQEVALVLARAFERPVAIVGKTTACTGNPQLFAGEKERTVIDWCRKNKKACGRGTDTLRDALIQCQPIVGQWSESVVVFDCSNSKLLFTDGVRFGMIAPILTLLL